MEKNLAKDVLSKLSENDVVQLTFLGGTGGCKPGQAIRDKVGAVVPRTALTNGSYKVVNKRKGRGQGGSLLLTILNTETGVVGEIGTPAAYEILNLTTSDGTAYGCDSEAQLPKQYAVNRETATALKEAFQTFRTMKLPARIRLTSTSPDFNGEWNVTAAKLNAGKFGQISLSLQNDAGNTTELWSYRHSGVINNVELLTEEDAASAATSTSPETPTTVAMVGEVGEATTSNAVTEEVAVEAASATVADVLA